MTDYFTQQLDYITFLYGLSLVLLGAVCASIARTDRKIPWNLLSFFAWMSGISAWIDLVAMSVVAHPACEIAQIILDLASFVALVEFARLGTAAVSRMQPGQWTIAVLIICASPGIYWGVPGIAASLRYALVLPGGLWTACVLLKFASSWRGPWERALRLAASLFGLYAILAVVVPPAYFFPAEIINTAVFFQLAGFPIQLMRGLVVVCATASMWRYYQLYACSAPSVATACKIRNLAAVSLGVLLSLGWILTSAAGNYADNVFRKNLLARAVSASAGISPESLARLEGSENDLDTRDHNELRRNLSAMRSANTDARYMYILAMRGGRLVFLLDAEDPRSPNYSPPGEVYLDATPELIGLFESGKSLVEGPVTDGWGTWISGLAAIKDARTGRVLGVLGIDVSWNRWQNIIAFVRLSCILITLLVCALTLTFFQVLWNKEESAVAVRNSEHCYRSLVNASPNWVSLLDENGRLLTINKSGMELINWGEEICGQSFVSLWPEEEQPKARRSMERALGGRRCSFEGMQIRSDGNEIIWYVVLTPMTDSDDVVNGCVLVAVEVTERTRATQALAKRLDYENMLAEISFSAIAVEDPEKFQRECLRTMGETMSASRVCIYKYSVSANSFDCAFEWDAPGIAPARHSYQNIAADDLSWWSVEMKSNRIISYSDIADVPGEREKKILTQLGVKSVLVIPLFAGKQYYGFLVFDQCCCRREWPDEDIDILKTIAQILGGVIERKDAEKALINSELRYKDLFESANDIILIVDDRGCIIDINHKAEELTGYSRDELIGRNVMQDFIVEEDEDKTLDAVVNIMAGRKHVFEVKCRAKNGDVLYLEGSCSPCLDQNGALNLVHCILRDVSERKCAEEKLRRERAQLMLVFESITAPVYVADVNTHEILYANRALCEQLGKDVVGGLCYKELQQCDAPCSFCNNERLLRDPSQPVQWEYYNPKVGKDYLITDTIIKWTDGRDVRFELAIDITERKKAEALLRIQTTAINAASDQIVIADANGRIEFVNPAFERETGYSAQEVIGRSSHILKSGKHGRGFYTEMWRTIRAGLTWHGEIMNKRKDGSLYTDDVTITPVTNDSGIIEHFIAIKRNITEKKIYEERLDHLAHHDSLTGLPNRLLFSDRLNQKLAEARRSGSGTAVMFLDLDRFKVVNDSLGHRAGDLLLKAVAERLRRSLRDVDTIARMGGDEFTIIVSDVTSSHDASVVAKKVIQSLSTPITVDDRELFVSTSIGISLFPSDGDDVETLVRNADTAMYRAKELGRNNYQFYTHALNAAALEQMNLENALRKAVEREEFLIHYQPRVDINTGEIVGAEALVRWKHPQLGLVSPGEFIPLAEETGLIRPISEFVLRSACRQAVQWQSADHRPLDIAVNVSVRQFKHGIAEAIHAIVTETGLDPRRLDIEITESTLMHNPDLATEIICRLKEMGARISIDDFGTGYSSLAYLKRFPIDAVKIDRSFVKDISTDSDDAAIATAIVAMAHSLQLLVIAEGVETLEQLEFLRSLHCDEMQGYFVSPPVPAEEFDNLLRRQREQRRAA